jgi:hypothetical protein
MDRYLLTVVIIHAIISCVLVTSIVLIVGLDSINGFVGALIGAAAGVTSIVLSFKIADKIL